MVIARSALPRRRYVTSLTLVENVPKKLYWIDCAAVPPSVLELKLAFGNSHLSSGFDSPHHLSVPPTDGFLTFVEASQAITTILVDQLTSGRHSSQGSGTENSHVKAGVYFV